MIALGAFWVAVVVAVATGVLQAGFVAQGLVQGSLAALNALGIVLLWRTTRVVNLAQPALGLVSGVLVGMLVTAGGWSFWWALPIGLAFGALLGLLAERIVLVRLQDVPRVVVLVATVGLAQVFQAIQAAIPFIFGGRLPTYTVDLGFTLDVYPILLRGPHLLALISMPLVLWGLYYFLHRSRMGLAACALGQDAERARTLGIPANVLRSMVWALAGLISSVTGILAIPVLGFSLDAGTGALVLLLALAPAVLAGFRSLPIAAVSALAVGVAYQAALVWTNRAGIADLVLAAMVLAAVAVQRKQLGREAAASRASSWEAATTPRPLPWAVAQSMPIKTATALVAALGLAAAALTPVLLSPSNDVLYATSASLALGALAVATAWMFAGEVPLGHWGLAGLGAAVAAITPGPWAIKFIVAGVLLSVAGAALAMASRRRSSLGFAVLGLAAAAAAPVALLAVGSRTQPTDPGIVGAIAGATCILAVIGLSKLRSSLIGARMVASRDDPQRAPWLGADPTMSRVIALSISGLLTGLAGSFYLASTPAGIAPGAFDPMRSLDLLAMAVIGGLGSPIGSLLGAISLQLARYTLPDAWAMLASGAGILVVVIFLPGGLGRAVEALRLRIVRFLVGDDIMLAPTRERIQSLVRPGGRFAATAGIIEGIGPRIAGSDTREASNTPTIRAAATAAALAMGPGWAAAGGMAIAWTKYLRFPSGGVHVLAVTAVLVILASALIAWQLAPILLDRRTNSVPRVPPGVGAAVGIISLGLWVGITGDVKLGALALVAVTVLAGWCVGQATRYTRAACVKSIVPAANGIVVMAAMLGIFPAMHIALVAAGSGFRRASVWGAVYGSLSVFWFLKARRALPLDRKRVQARVIVTSSDERRAAAGPVSSLVVDGVGATFGITPVLRGASLSVASSEVVALVGGNGAGKSTLLRVVAGLIIPDTGRILVGGEDVTTLRPEERAQAGLAFVSGARPVFPDLSVIENLRVAAYRSHASGDSFDKATDAVLELVPALAHRRDSKVGVLSGGEQRLLAVAQSLYRRPIALLADELTLGLDVDARHAVLDVFRLLADDGVAVVVVDHDLPALLPRADRAILVAGGTLSEFPDPMDLLRRRSDLLPATFLAGVS